MSNLIPTVPCTPAKPTQKREIPLRPASPLSPTPGAPTDSAEFAATFGRPSNGIASGKVTLRLAGASNGELEVAATTGSPPHDGDSPGGASMVESPCPPQATPQLLAVNKALESYQRAALVSASHTTGYTEAAMGANSSSAASNLAGVASATLQLQPSPMTPSAGLRCEPAPSVAAAGAVIVRDGTMGQPLASGSSACAVSSSAAAVVVAAGPAPSCRLAEKMSVERVVAMGREFWLAYGDAFRASTSWFRDGRADILVYRAAAEAAREAQAAHAADPDSVAAPESPDRAIGWMIGTLTADRCYVRADGNYKGQTPNMVFHKPFAQTTLSCALGPPPADFPEMVGDYQAALASLRSVLPKGANEKSGHVYQNLGGQHLRLRHALFAPKPEPEDEGTDGADGAALPAHFTMAGWPTYSAAAAEALADISESHVVRPLPAFDVKGDLIHPSRYLVELRGATMLAGFRTTVYNIGEKNATGRDVVRTNVCLDIEYLRVLIAPPQFSPKKRAVVHLTDPISHASKKRRAFWKRREGPGGDAGRPAKVKRENSPAETCADVLGDDSEESEGDEVLQVLLAGCGDEVLHGDLLRLVPPDIEHEGWVAPWALIRLTEFLEFTSPPSEPWYSLTKVPSDGASWEMRGPGQSILTVFGLPLRLFAVGPIVDMGFFTGIYNKYARSRVTIRMMRARDRLALCHLLHRANWTCNCPATAPVERFTALAVHNYQEVFRNIYDATTTYTARDCMTTVHPSDLKLGDIVLVEAVVVRTEVADSWSVAFHTDAIARLVENPHGPAALARGGDGNVDVPIGTFGKVLCCLMPSYLPKQDA
ncbi:hypothetical protein K466DRAFT_596200 [Polyporus arcularius HHB13444]|uniref:Uncharacterized protein n=1 Tax=Polyporus arcularius HHB13444 TaxID=1314778 RepID=A0A5C3PNM6_9APHY|nr:hypothetical protein K466DRAFT_596200 [Polyporus arcularius HHB13444]